MVSGKEIKLHKNNFLFNSDFNINPFCLFKEIKIFKNKLNHFLQFL